MDFIQRLMAQCHAAAGSGLGSPGGTGTPGGGSPSATPTPTPASTPASTPGQGSNASASPTGDQRGEGSNTNTPDPNANDPAFGNWKAMRDNLQAERTRAAALEGQVATYTQIQTTAKTLATSLGYTEQDFQDAFAADPVKTIALLQQERDAQGQSRPQQGQQQGQENILDQIKNLVKQETAPVTEHVNRQITDAAYAKYETNLADSIKADPILQNAPTEVHDIVKDYLQEYFASQPQILAAMKTKGDFSSVKEAVTYISGRLNTAFSKWLAQNNKTGGAPQGTLPGQGGRQGGAKLTLDDIINDPGVLGAQYKQ